jgi:DNA processing protein
MRDREYSTYMLLNAPGLGAKSISYIYGNLKNLGLKVNDLFENSLSQLTEYFPEIGRGKFSRADLSSLHSLDDERLYTSYLQLKKENVHIIGLDDERYPKHLAERLGVNTPPVLFCKGNLSLLNANSISIVGSRDISDLAITLTKRIANRIAGCGYNVTSGFAKGVDTSAHIGSLESNGTTTMVLSYGFNHLSIKKDIKEFNWENNTLFISQFLPYEKFSGQNAMTRNKLVCALSKAVIVISSGPERDASGKMSGTFDAGVTALRHNIPLFVLNPSLLNTAPKGNTDLIKMGGIPLSNGNELVQYLDSLNSSPQIVSTNYVLETELSNQTLQEPQTAYQTKSKEDIKEKILNLFNGKPLSINEIIEQAHLDWTPQQLTSYLKKVDEIEIVNVGSSKYYKRKNLDAQPKLF